VQVPSREDVESGMPYTAACLQETLRKYSIVPVLVRTAVRDTKLLDRFIPAGTKCSIMVSSTHRLWKDPDAYSPERFLPGGEFESFPEDVRR
jgi:cytochrome P450